MDLRTPSTPTFPALHILDKREKLRLGNSHNIRCMRGTHSGRTHGSHAPLSAMQREPPERQTAQYPRTCGTAISCLSVSLYLPPLPMQVQLPRQTSLTPLDSTCLERGKNLHLVARLYITGDKRSNPSVPDYRGQWGHIFWHCSW